MKRGMDVALVAVVVLLAAAAGGVVVRNVSSSEAEAELSVSVGPAGSALTGAGAGSGRSGGSRLGSAAPSAAGRPSVLESALAARGLGLPAGTNVYAAVAQRSGGTYTYETFEAGGGGRADGFWPASVVKPLVAVGALEFLAGMGFTGAATVTFGDEPGAYAVRDLAEDAVRASSNDAYDALVQVAGVDWLNDEFLTLARGFPATVIQRSYVLGGLVTSPPMTVREGDRVRALPERVPTGDRGVPGDGNRTNLLEMADSIDRIVRHSELPATARFRIADDDAAALRYALLTAEGFVAPDVTALLGSSSLVYNKAGYVVGDDCVEVDLVRHPAFPAGVLLGISTPDDAAECAVLGRLAVGVLDFLKTRS